MIDEAEALERLREACREAGSQKAFCSKHGLSVTPVNMAFKGRINLPQSVLDALGLERVSMYRVKAK